MLADWCQSLKRESGCCVKENTTRISAALVFRNFPPGYGRMVTRDPLAIFVLLVLWRGRSLGDNILFHAVNYGENITLPCYSGNFGSSDEEKASISDDDWLSHRDTMWVRQGREDEQIARMSVQYDGSLSLSNLDRDDSGVYLCVVEDDIRMKVKLEVRAPPPALANVTIIPSTVLALLLWEVTDTGGYPISHFSARYRLKDPVHLTDHHPREGKAVKDNSWHWVVPEHINPSVREIDVYQLHPNSSYVFEIWATNQLGAGETTQMETHTQNNAAEIELARHLLEGAETFDTRVWVAAVAVVMGTLVMLALGTCYLLYKECHISHMNLDEHEIMELVPNIILNPGFHDDDGGIGLDGHYDRDENCNNRRTMHTNNNSTVQPYRI